MDANTSRLLEEERRQEKAEQRQEMIEAMARDLVQPGQEYDPWKYDNFMEAIENAPDMMQRVMFVTVAVACDSELKNDYSNHLALTSIKKLVEDYWFEVAKVKAEKEMKTHIEMIKNLIVSFSRTYRM